MTRYTYLKNRIDHLSIVASSCDDYARNMIKDQILALTTILEGYTLEEAEKEIA